MTTTSMEAMKQFFHERDRLARLLGIEIIELEPGYARVRMKIQDHHLNGVDLVHGGTIFTLADVALGAAANAHGTLALAIDTHISFVKAGKDGVLTAEANEISKGPKLATYSVLVRDEDGSVLATFQGMVYRKQEKMPPA